MGISSTLQNLDGLADFPRPSEAPEDAPKKKRWWRIFATEQGTEGSKNP